MSGDIDDPAGSRCKTRENCERITEKTTTLKDEGWYYVEGHVELDHGLVLEDEAHIILMNGSRLVIHAKDNTPGIAVRYGYSNSDDLFIFGQQYDPEHETGVLEVHGGKNAAGIGGICEESRYRHCGNIYIRSGHVIAYGGENAAGIGGSHVNDDYSGDGPDSLYITGGRVEAFGGRYASGVGAACKGKKTVSYFLGDPEFEVEGGLLEATGGEGRYAIGAYSKKKGAVGGKYIGKFVWTAPSPTAAFVVHSDIPTCESGYVRVAGTTEWIGSKTKRLINDQWYYVKGKVECGPLSVSGSPHLVFDRDAELVVKGGENQVGLAIDGRSSLEMFGSIGGKLTVEKAIGSRQGQAAGALTVHGGSVAAGRINGSKVAFDDATVNVGGDIAGDGLVINSGSVTAQQGVKSSTVVLGPRVVKVDDRHYRDNGVRVSFEVPDDLRLVSATSDGGIRTMEESRSYMVESGHSLTLTFLPSYNKDALVGSGVVTFGPFGGDAVLDADQFPKLTSRVLSVPYVESDGTRHVANACLYEPTPVESSLQVMEEGWYVVTAKVAVASIEIRGTVNLILADGSQLRADKGGIRIGEHASLNIYGQAAGTGELIARGSSYPAPDSAGIGSCLNGAGGSVTINGGIVRATGAYNCAGIGAGGMATFGTVTINGGQVVATGGGYAAGIGGGLRSSFDEVTINGGTVTAQHGRTDPFGTVRCAPDIGRGVEGVDGPVTIDGGSVKASEIRNAPKNTAGELLYKVTVECEVLGAECGVRVAGLEEYGTRDLYPVDGRVYLWLPEGTHDFSLKDGTASVPLHYHAIVNGRDIDVEPLPVGFFVNGRDIGDGPEPGSGWSYDRTDGVLKFSAEGNYVLSGFATNDEVQIKVDADDAKIILSNAVVYASNRPAFVVNHNRITSLLMAGDTSYLAARGDFHAMTVESGASVAVDLVQERDRLESMICVLNSSDISEAIGGNGSIAVNGGTFVVWGSQKAIGNLETFSIGSGMVMKTGNDVEVAQYTTACDNEPCVIVGPAVTVTVRDDIPNVTGHTVSNALQEITGDSLDGVTTYRVMLEDDVFVGYTLAEGYASQVGNPLSYPEIKDDILVDISVIPTLQIVPYRAWNETMHRMEDRVCDVYTVVTDDLDAFEGGEWYVVTNDVECGAITVNGSAHLILADGAALTAESLTGGSLTVYGQSEGSGALVVSGALTTQVKNARGQGVYGVTAEVEKLNVEKLNVEGLAEYGITGTRVIDGKAYLWLPNGAHVFTLSDGNAAVKYRALVDGAAVTAEKCEQIGFSVNGSDVGSAGAGNGWTYFGRVLTLSGEDQEYVLSGLAENDEVQIRVASNSGVVLEDAFVFTSGRPALEIEKGLYLQLAGGTSVLAATNGASAVTLPGRVHANRLQIDLAPGGVRGTSALEIRNFGDTAPAVYNRGEVAVWDGTLRVSSGSRAFWWPFAYDTGLTGKGGDSPETAVYMDDLVRYDMPYVAIAPVCLVKVPRTEGVSCVVSNQAGRIPGYGTDAEPQYEVFRTMLGDDITVDFTAAWGYEITYGGHVRIPSIKEDEIIDKPVVEKVKTPEWPNPQVASNQTAAAFYRIPTSAKLADADAGAIAAWATANSVTPDKFTADPDAYEKAFLLNCGPDHAAAEAAAYRILSFGQNADGEWEIAVQDTNTEGKPYNGRSEFRAYSDAACTVPAEDEEPSSLFIRSFLIVAPAGEK